MGIYTSAYRTGDCLLPEGAEVWNCCDKRSQGTGNITKNRTASDNRQDAECHQYEAEPDHGCVNNPTTRVVRVTVRLEDPSSQAGRWKEQRFRKVKRVVMCLRLRLCDHKPVLSKCTLTDGLRNSQNHAEEQFHNGQIFHHVASTSIVAHDEQLTN